MTIEMQQALEQFERVVALADAGPVERKWLVQRLEQIAAAYECSYCGQLVAKAGAALCARCEAAPKCIGTDPDSKGVCGDPVALDGCDLENTLCRSCVHWRDARAKAAKEREAALEETRVDVLRERRKDEAAHIPLEVCR